MLLDSKDPSQWCAEAYKLVFKDCLLFRAEPAAYRSSQARGGIGAAVASLCHSHSNTGSELHLQTTPQLVAMPDLQPTEQGQGSNCILTETSSGFEPAEPQWEHLNFFFFLAAYERSWARGFLTVTGTSQLLNLWCHQRTEVCFLSI